MPSLSINRFSAQGRKTRLGSFKRRSMHPVAKTSGQFGASLAIRGNHIIVGAPGYDTPTLDDAGAAYLFQIADGQYTLQREFTGNVSHGRLGTSVSITSEFAAAGAPGTGQQEPYVYLFEKLAGSNWSLDSSDITRPSTLNERFGYSVHVDDSTLFVGCPWSVDKFQPSSPARIGVCLSAATWSRLKPQ